MSHIIADSDDEDETYDIRSDLRDSPSLESGGQATRVEAPTQDEVGCSDVYEVVSPQPSKTTLPLAAESHVQRDQDQEHALLLPSPKIARGNTPSSTIMNSTSTNAETIGSFALPTSLKSKSMSGRDEAPSVDRSFTSTLPMVLIPTVSEHPRKRKAPPREQTHEKDEDEDELACGLPPREQYKPRPSRSRSMGSSLAQDSGSAPTSKRLRRSKTIDDGSSLDAASTRRQTTDALVGMGYRSSQVAIAMRHGDNDLHRALDYLTSEQANSAHAFSGAQPMVDDADLREAIQLGDDTASIVPRRDLSAAPSIDPLALGAESTAATPASKADPKKRRGRPPTKVAAEAAQDSPKPEAKSGKRGRGRPKKPAVESDDKQTDMVVPNAQTITAEAAPEPVLDDENGGEAADETRARQEKTEHGKREPLGDKDHNVSSAGKDAGVAQASPLTKPPPSARKTPSSLAAICARTGQTHRVGLSRRLRIEPLLQKMKK